MTETAHPSGDGAGSDVPYQRTPQESVRGGPQGSQQAESTLWKGHPALRSTFYHWILAIAVTYGIHLAFPYIQAGLAGAGNGLLTEDQMASVLYWSHLLYALPALYVGIKTLARFLVSYELTTQRIIIRTGLLVRRRNEVALHRIRDYQVEKPIYWGILGIGYALIISRDEAIPNLRMGPIPHTSAVLDQIREAAFAYQREMGYREFESW
ncbi:PH domain-containing protein [Fodinicurvata sp. EGI_FJ10296]|uniref:PH domain-containing protein n=1 Tax=Fodinicurvata sp. EGI_FJ10296 TaxID=3231908 RepID=UPI003453146B